MATAASASGRKTRKDHTVGAVRPSTNFFNSSNDDNNLDALRIQRVIAIVGVSPVIAAVIAPLAFGGGA